MNKAYSIIFISLISILFISCKKSELTNVAITKNDNLKQGLTTAIEYDKVYDKKITSYEEAKIAIKEYGNIQRNKYNNPKINIIEQQLEEDYDITAVNLGEIDEATALDIKKACDYIYNEYPQIKGTLTNISLGNFNRSISSDIAITEVKEFLINENFGNCPFVVKYSINLNAAKFFNRDELLKTCSDMIECGHWNEDTDISALIVHELGHQVLNVIAMKEFGLYNDQKCFTGYYITNYTINSYSDYITDQLSINQTISQKILLEAYNLWINKYNGEGNEDDFRLNISGYAGSFQSDGGISYPEAIAEAIADVYLHKDNADNCSKAVVETIKNNL